jgi:hypothetical protein
MPITLPIQKMTRADQLRAMEMLWADLAREDGKVASPKWHEDALHEAEKAVKAGTAIFSDWEEAKKKIVRKATARSR